jgi:hypothetical protein
MSIQSFAETLLSNLDKDFEGEANKLLNEARQRTGGESYIAGRMDGLSDAVKQVQATYKLFVKSEKEDEDESRAIY